MTKEWTCQICGFETDNRFEVDLVIKKQFKMRGGRISPWESAGGITRDNLCFTCANTAKSYFIMALEKLKKDRQKHKVWV